MNQKKLSYEHVLFLTAIALAAILRFYQLGAAPLTDKEAYWANQALLVSKWGPNIDIGPNPGYVLLTGAVFSLFGSTEFTARFWPALAGCLIILTAWLLSAKLENPGSGRLALLFLAFGLALDPGLVIVSRQAGGPMMAIGFGTIALISFFLQKNVASGIFAGLALLSGPFVYPGTLSIGIAGAAVYLIIKRAPSIHSSDSISMSFFTQKTRVVHFLIACLGTILIIGTFFFKFPQGLSAWLTSIQVYIEGWLLTTGTSIGLMLVAWIVFELMAIIFFLAALGRRIVETVEGQSRTPPWQIFMYLWLGLSFILAVFYPSRDVAGLGWAIVPLWFIAAGEFAVLLPVRKVSPISVILALFTFILMSLFWFTLSAVAKLPSPGTALDLRFLVPVGVLILIGLSAALVSLGWTYEVGQKGLAWGMCVALMIYSFSTLSGAAYQHPNDPTELWGSDPGSGQNLLFQQTLDDISRKLTGIKGAADIVATPDSPSLRWSLRNYPQTRFISEPPADEMPSIVITPAEQEFPALAAAYTGQDFVWWTWRGWPGTIPPNAIRWLNYREAPIQNQKIILWVRTDLLPGTPPSTSQTPENP